MVLHIQHGGEPGPAPRWIRCGGRLDELDDLAEPLRLHQLAVEDARNPRQRPKLEVFGEDRFFIVMRIPRPDPDNPWQHVAIFVNEDSVVTASSERLPELDAVEQRYAKRNISIGRLTHAIVDRLVDAWFPYLDNLEDEVERIGDMVLQTANEEGRVAIRSIKDVLARSRKVSLPLRDAMISLERLDHPIITSRDRPFFRDVSDHMTRIQERLDHVREAALTAQETWMATLAQSQNQNMQRLTVLFALFLIPGLFSGLGGMNFPGIPEWDYWVVTGIILGFVVVGAAVSRVRGWL